MKRALSVAVVAAVVSLVTALPAHAEDAPLIEVVTATASAAPGEMVRIGVKAARPDVTITSGAVWPRAARQYVMPLNDSGLLGDVAGDGIWSIAFPVPDAVPAGVYDLDLVAQVLVAGEQVEAAATAQLEILPGESRMLRITSHHPGDELAGEVVVTARLETWVPARRVVAYLGAAWADLEPEGDEWRGALDTTGAANGRQQLMVVASVAGTAVEGADYGGLPALLAAMNLVAEIPVLVRNPYHYYWGDLHAHTAYSDGVETPAVAYRHARDVARLDFFAVTDHERTLTFDEYDDIRRQADAFDDPGAFAALWGVEWTHEVGHFNYLMAERFVLPADLGAAYSTAAELGLMGHFNHPWVEDFNFARYHPLGAEAIAATEVRSPKEEVSYIAMLDAGWRVGADGSQDKHDATWGEGPHWTVILARRLDRASVLEAVRARRTYSSGDRNLRLDFSLDGHDMGSVISRPAGALPLSVSIFDPDPGDTTARIEAILNGQVAAAVEPGTESYHWRQDLTFTAGRHYLYIRATQTDGDRIYSSPIWVYAYQADAP